MQNKDRILEKETNNREREREHLNKKDLFHKLSKLSSKQIKDIGLTNKDIDYLKNKILNDKLGLVLNYQEHDEFFENHYFGLEEVKDLHINPKDKNNHLLIEGDNYYALKALLASGIKVDVIYIDPPYNTGNKDFVYNDSFVEKDDQFKHSKWLSFMKNRLELARELLADDGVIFVSIDDNEQAYLKVLMDEIFGEENFVATVVFDKTSQGTTLGEGFKRTHEFILCFRKSFDFKLNLELKSDLSKYNNEDEIGKYAVTNKLNSINSYLEDNRNRGYTIYYNESKNDVILKYEYDKKTLIYQKDFNKELISKGYVGIRPGLRKNQQTCWNWSEERFLKDWKNEIIFKKDSNGNIFPYHKNRINETQNPFTIQQFDSRVGGAGLLNRIFNKVVFDYAKPINLVKWVIQRHANKNSTIIDFFAGSGTTAQAVMELNEEDGGNRRFILCTNNENNIATDICRERIYRVINGKGSENEIIDWKYSDDKKSLDNNSMKYLRVKPIHKINGDYEDINDMEPIYVDEFDKDYISIKDFK